MNKKPNSDIVNYVWTYLNQGHSLSSIRDALLQQGFSLNEINYAVDYVYANYYYQGNNGQYTNPEFQKNVKEGNSSAGVHKVIILVLIIIGVSIIGFSSIFLLSNSTSEVPGSRDSVNYEGSYEPPSTRNTEVKKEQEIPPVDEKVAELTPPPQTIPKTDPNKNTATQDVGLSIRQINIKVDYYAKTDPRQAINYCNMHETKQEKSQCISKVSLASGIPAYCAEIDVVFIRDRCYFDMILEGKSDNNCNLIQDETLKTHCDKLVKINKELKQYDLDSNYTQEPDWDQVQNYYAIPANFY